MTLSGPIPACFSSPFFADGINRGLIKMAEACPGSTKSSLEDIQAWYIRDETYSVALAELVNAQGKRPLAAFWGDETTSSSGGQNFRSGRYSGRLTRNMGRSLDVNINLSFPTRPVEMRVLRVRYRKQQKIAPIDELFTKANAIFCIG